MIEHIDSGLQALTTDTVLSKLLPDTVDIISLFNNHLLQADSINPSPIVHSSFNTFFYWLLSISILIVFAKVTYYKQFSMSFLSNFSQRNYSLLQQLGDTIRHPLNLILLIVYIISGALFLSIISYDYINQETYTINSLVFQNIIIISGVVLSTIIIAEFFRYLFQIDILISTYYESTVQSYNLSSLILTLGIWFIIFSGIEIATMIILGLLTMQYLYRIYNLLIHIRIKNKYSLFHYIIYICTVEILPLIIATKLYFVMVLQ